MADIIFATVAIAFFALCVAYVLACDRIIGKRQSADSPTGADPNSDTGADTEVTHP